MNFMRQVEGASLVTISQQPCGLASHLGDSPVFSALGQRSQLGQRLITLPGQLDIANACGFGRWQHGQALRFRGFGVGIDHLVTFRSPELQLAAQIVCGGGQLMVAAEVSIYQPARQVLPNHRRPVRVECIDQAPADIATPHHATFKGCAIDAKPGVPLPAFIQCDRLLVGFSRVAGQTPAARIPAQLYLVDAALTLDEVAVGKPVDPAVEAVAGRFCATQGNRLFIVVILEARQHMSGVALRLDLQCRHIAHHRVQLTRPCQRAGRPGGR
ncbi:hypothetical protein D3C81_1296210 [compost metagenome]